MSEVKGTENKNVVNGAAESLAMFGWLGLLVVPVLLPIVYIAILPATIRLLWQRRGK